MSQANVDLLREAFDAFNREGVDAIIEILDPEFEAVAPPELTVEPDTYKGHAGIRRYFDSFYEVMEEVHFYPQEFIDAGDKVVVPMVLWAKGRGTGIEAEQRIVQVWTIRQGKATRVENYADRAAALEAVGLEAPDGSGQAS
jgi:ketosteroid isomerase-like protein